MDLIYAAGLVSNKSRTATAPVAVLEQSAPPFWSA